VDETWWGWLSSKADEIWQTWQTLNWPYYFKVGYFLKLGGELSCLTVKSWYHSNTNCYKKANTLLLPKHWYPFSNILCSSSCFFHSNFLVNAVVHTIFLIANQSQSCSAYFTSNPLNRNWKSSFCTSIMELFASILSGKTYWFFMIGNPLLKSKMWLCFSNYNYYLCLSLKFSNSFKIST
jgi:hypothetical protein